MPETIGAYIVTALVSAEVATMTIGSVTFASIVGNVVVAGSLIAANYALSDKPESTPQDGQLSVRQTRAARRRNYGRVKIGGALMFSEAKGGVRFQVIALNHGEIDSFVEHWAADTIAEVNPSGGGPVMNIYIASNGTHCVDIRFYRGTDSDPAFPFLLERFPEYWTAAHQGKGIAKALVITQQPVSEEFTLVYPGGTPPVYRAVVNAVRVWDPRDSAQDRNIPATWTWTENPVLIALDFHRHPDGMGLAPFDASFFGDDCLAEDWIPQANICDEAIALKAGGTEPRYRCSGGYELPAPPKQVLNAILATCDAETYQRPDGGIGIRAGKTVSPTVTIADKHILSYSNFIKGSSDGITPVNVVTAKYTARDLDYQDADADPWRDEDSIADTGREESRNLDLTWVPSHAQSRRLMKIAAKRYNPDWTVQILTDLDGLRAYGERFIRVEIAELFIDGTAEVTSFEIMPATMTCAIGLRAFDQSAYDWDPEFEEGTAPNVADTSSGDDAIENPADVDATVEGTTIRVTWTASGRLDTTPELQYRTNPDGDWLPCFIDSPTEGHTPPLAVGYYDVQVRFNVGSHSSGWSPVLNIHVI